MNHFSRCTQAILLTLTILGKTAAFSCSSEQPADFKVMTWNIWHGGREDGNDVGPARVVDVIRSAQADVVAMQETYGSGELIAKELGFHLLARGTNLSIHSRFPILEDVSVFEEFKCVGALLELPDNRRLIFYSIWLPYDKDIWLENSRAGKPVSELVKACQPSADDLREVHTAIRNRLKDDKYAGIPVIIAGDFNSMSHLDYSAVAKSDFGNIIDWPTSRILTNDGFRDAYREVHPTVHRLTDRTWSPRFPQQEQDRIDFIYYHGGKLEAVSAANVDSHAEKFPSDHAAVVAGFRWRDSSTESTANKLKVLSYNIKHGEGMDGKLNLDRTTQAIRTIAPDVVGLQEVDLDCRRSGTVNQPRAIGKELGMHAAFGSFMDFQGGRYGLAILSRHPIYDVRECRLPNGNEPRVALAATCRLPTGREVTVVNIHLDWVDDDAFRYQQALAVRSFLKELKEPIVLLGDFNDIAGSRTIDLFRSDLMEATKPADARFTFPSSKPNIEIDFIFAAPKQAWKLNRSHVVDDPVTSDHRPFFAELEYTE